MSALTNQEASWVFDKECTIYHAATLHDKLQSLFNKARVVTLDMSSVEVIDASIIQLLVATYQEALKINGEVKIISASKELKDFSNRIYCQIILGSDAMEKIKEGNSDES